MPQRRSLRSFLTFLLFGLFALAVAPPERASANVASDARAEFERGVEATQQARWDEAKQAFQRSLDLVVKPSTLFNLAVTNVKLGLGRDALRALDTFESMAGPEHASMLERGRSLRAAAERLAESEQTAKERVRTLIEPSGLAPAARREFELGREAYAQGDDKLALDAFARAHALSDRSELLYDIGVVADRLRDDGRAVTAFRGFVAAFPSAPEAALAKKRIERLTRARADEETGAVVAIEESAGSAAPVDHDALRLRPARTLIVLGAALAVVSLGTAFWWVDRNDAARSCVRADLTCDNDSQIDRQKRAAAALTLGLDAAAIALVTGGGVWLAKRKRTARAQAAMGRGRFELGLRFTF